MTRSTPAAPDPAPPHHRPDPNLKGSDPFRFDLRDQVPFAHLPDTPLTALLRQKTLVEKSKETLIALTPPHPERPA